MSNICVVYGGNSSLIKSIKTDLIKSFDLLILISRSETECDSEKIINIIYENIEDIAKNLKSIIRGNKITFISAAAYSSNKLFLDENFDTITESIEVNLINNIKIIQILLNESIKTRNGIFIFISSFRSDIPTKGTCIYSSSKIYMEKLFNSLSIEYSRFDQRFLILKIGLFEKGLSENLPFDISSKKFLNNNLSRKRVSTSKDIFSAIKFIIDNEYINGTELDMTGKLLIDLKI